MERKVNLKEVRDQFYQYALSEHEEDIRVILEDVGDPTRHIPIYINFLTLSESCAVLTDLLRTSGSQVLPALDLALTRAARHLYGRLTDDDVHGLTLKTRLHARLIELPVCAELQRTCVPRIEDEGRLLCVSGTVVRAGLPHLLDTRAHYTCNKCKHQFIVWADYEQSYQTERPVRCPNPQPCRAGSGFSPSAAPDTGLRDHQARDYQEIRLQEQVQKLDVGKIPRGLCVVLEDDLVDSCKAGDDVIVTGMVRQRWRSAVRGSPPDIELTLHANRVFVNSEQRTSLLLTEQRLAQFTAFWQRHRHDPLAGRNAILQRFCSQIYGMYVVKLAVALTLVGGVRRVTSGTATRGEPHLLLIGDPGTGKSQLLKYAARLCPRSVLTTGIGSTSAGLTCCAVKEGPEWQLEAGALVLADGGVCCIDEFNSVRESDKTSIHEAMEQQTISVAKAGMVCKLNTRCSILAAANPRVAVDWETDDDVLSKLGLGSPLLSRFDLILVLKDGRSRGWDRLVSGYILSGLDPLSGGRASSQAGEQAEAADWNLETLQAYLAHVRALQPQPDQQAITVLQTYYQRLRGRQTAGRSRTTVRLLESLLRLTQAHARLRCSADGARLCDAVVAVTLMEASLGGLGGGLLGADGVGSILHTGFPESADDEYRAQCELILGHLGLDDMLSAELAELERRRWLDPAEDGPSEEARPAAAADRSPGRTAESAAGRDTDQSAGRRPSPPPAPPPASHRRPSADVPGLRQPGRDETRQQRGLLDSADTNCSNGESLAGSPDSRLGGEEVNTTDSADVVLPHGTAAGAGHRSRFAGLRARAAAASASTSSPAAVAAASPAASEPADSLTRIRPAGTAADRRASESASESPAEPPAAPVLQLDRFRYVRPTTAAAARTVGRDPSSTADRDPSSTAGRDPSPAARTPSYSSALDMDDMDDDFESLLSGGLRGGESRGGGGSETRGGGGGEGGSGGGRGGGDSLGGGGGRGRGGGGGRGRGGSESRGGGGGGSGRGRGGGGSRAARPGRPAPSRVRSDGAAPDQVAAAGAGSRMSPPAPSSASGTGGESAPSPAPSRRTLSAATLSKLARFSADVDPVPGAEPVAEPLSELPVSRDGGSARSEELSVSRDGGEARSEELPVSRDGGSARSEELSVSRDGGEARSEELPVSRDGAEPRSEVSVSRDGGEARSELPVSRDGGSARSEVSVSRDGGSARSEEPPVSRDGGSARSEPPVSRDGGEARSEEPSVSRDGGSARSELPRDGGSARLGDRSTLPVSGRRRSPAGGQSQFESADDGLCDLELDFSWPPSKRSKS